MLQYGAGLEDLEPDFNQLDYISDSGEEEDWWNDRNYIQSGVKVQVGYCLRASQFSRKQLYLIRQLSHI